MAKINYSHIQKSLGSSLRITSYNNEFHEGYYIGDHLTIHFDGMRTRGTIPEHTSLIVQHLGIRYQRNYDKMFTEHGLKMVCANLQKDIISGRFKKDRKSKFQMPS